MTMTIGKLRGLQQCSSHKGTFTCMALDHRQNLRRAINPEDPFSVTHSVLKNLKLEIVSALASEATAVLLDPEYSAAQAIAAGVLPGNTGLVVAIEATGYTGDSTARQSSILKDWSVRKAKLMGASMVKLLVYYHPDAPTAHEIEKFVRSVSDECKLYDICLMLETLTYSLNPDQKKLLSDEKHYAVVETARKLSLLGVDLLKVEFPLDPNDSGENEWTTVCEEISAASAIPWILLSAAVNFETYLHQVAVACNSGASGIAVGRAVWKEAVVMTSDARSEFLQTIARQRLSQLYSLCEELGKPLQSFYPNIGSSLQEDWYVHYGR